ncbi:MAG TPA: hypothetical protein VGB85_24895 [Nannocystis sp.]|jgi:predicted nucleic acid-binding Zn finger protein
MATRRIVASPPAPVAAPTQPAPAPTPAPAPATSSAKPRRTVGSPEPRTGTLGTLFTELDQAIGDGRMEKVRSMLRADRFQLFSEVGDDKVTAVIKSQTNASLFYACSVDKGGRYMCCTQNLVRCGGLKGNKPCKHLLVMLVGLAQGQQLDPGVALQWARATKNKAPSLDKDSMSATFIRYKGAEAGEVDWRPTETIPEDYYAF